MRLPRIPELQKTEPELCQVKSPRKMYARALHIPDTKQMHNVRSEFLDAARRCVRRRRGKLSPIQMFRPATWIRNRW